jgi:hypothetical protein
MHIVPVFVLQLLQINYLQNLQFLKKEVAFASEVPLQFEKPLK